MRKTNYKNHLFHAWKKEYLLVHTKEKVILKKLGPWPNSLTIYTKTNKIQTAAFYLHCLNWIKKNKEFLSVRILPSETDLYVLSREMNK